jgi:hypothetical protein
MSPLFVAQSREETPEEKQTRQEQIVKGQRELIERAEMLGTISKEEAATLRKELGAN